MEVRFATSDIEQLYTEGKGTERYPSEVVSAFFRRVELIQNATDERDLRALKGVRFEKLRGSDRYSMRLNRQWRLEFAFERPHGTDKAAVIIEISKHYGD
jgi:proteic killer suppression protein